MKAKRSELIKAIQRHGGIVNRVAAEFKMSSSGLRKRLRENPDLKAAVAEARERMLDSAEAGLFKAIKQGKPWAIKLALTSVGRTRGYGKTVKVEGDHRAKIIIKLPDNNRRIGPRQNSDSIEYEKPVAVHSGTELPADSQDNTPKSDAPAQTTTHVEPFFEN